MKKWLSLVLSLVLLISAVPALAAPYDIAFLDTAKDWVNRANPEELDYVGNLTVMDNELVKGTVRAGNGITELKVETPVPSADPEAEKEYAEVALAQYAENGLAIKVGDETVLIDVNGIMNFLTRKFDYTKDAVKADAETVKSLVVRFVTEVLNPTISWNLLTGSATLHFDVNQDQFAERMPAFLESLSDQEDAINTLLAKYGADYALAFTEYEPTLEGIRKTWADYMEKTDNKVPEFTLKADAAISLPKQDQPLQVGVTGTFNQSADTCIFSVEYMPTKEGFLATAEFGGMYAGQIFSYTLEAHQDANTIDVDVTTADKETNLYNFYASKKNETVEISAFAYSVEKDQLNELVYERNFDTDTGDLIATLTHITGALADQQEDELCKLVATVQDKGIIGTITYGNNDSIRFTWTTAPLYYRLFLTVYQDNAARGEADLWLFPEGSGNYRYRVSVRTIGVSSLSDHYLATGTFNDSSFSLVLSEVGGDTLLNLSLARDDGDNTNAYTANCVALTKNSQINVSSLLVLTDKIPTSFDTDVTINSRDGKNRLNVYRLSWVPGTITYVDGINYYTIARTVNTEKELTYDITRNENVELGTISAKLSDEDEISLKVVYDNFNALATVKPVKEEIIDIQVPKVIGIIDGSVDPADGTMQGIITEPVEVEPEEVLKIQPIDVTDATIIDVKYIIRNYMCNK